MDGWGYYYTFQGCFSTISTYLFAWLQIIPFRVESHPIPQTSSHMSIKGIVGNIGLTAMEEADVNGPRRAIEVVRHCRVWGG